MSSILIWEILALNTYFEEIDFILLKWNNREAENFKDLVDENLLRLAKNPEIVVFKVKLNSYSLIISKQTILYYDYNSESNQINLLLFWNTLKNPADLIKLL